MCNIWNVTLIYQVCNPIKPQQTLASCARSTGVFQRRHLTQRSWQIKHLFHEDIGIIIYVQTSVPHPQQSNKPSASSSAVSQWPSLDNQINYWLSVLGTLNVELYYRSHSLDGPLMWSLCCPEIIYGAVSGFGQL